MPSFKDLTNERFGKWTVLYRDDDYVSPKGHHIPKWFCICDCGKTKSISSSILLRGESKSCGCSFGARRKDITGQRFGKLTALRVVGKEESRQTIWECICDCGTILSVRRRTLISGQSQSCGCRGKESWISLQVKKYFEIHYSALTEYKVVKNPKTGRYLPYDIYIPGGIFIELQGEQHYKYIPYFFKSKNVYEQRIKSDVLKKNFAQQHGIFIGVDLREMKSPQQVIDYIEMQL